MQSNLHEDSLSIYHVVYISASGHVMRGVHDNSVHYLAAPEENTDS